MIGACATHESNRLMHIKVVGKSHFWYLDILHYLKLSGLNSWNGPNVRCNINRDLIISIIALLVIVLLVFFAVQMYVMYVVLLIVTIVIMIMVDILMNIMKWKLIMWNNQNVDVGNGT
jgi:hypothetical protein